MNPFASVICDQIGMFKVFYSSKAYPAAMRPVVKDETGKRIPFLTYN